jgi:hypothetical protein
MPILEKLITRNVILTGRVFCFFLRRIWAILQGVVPKKRVAQRGFLMVNSLWNAGESWQVDGRFSGSKNMPLIPDLFWVTSHFGR